MIRLNWSMGDRQLRLLAPPKPLVERFGVEFFRAVPEEPGVYLMSGAAGEILYVGQSANLRRRLGSYRSANAEHVGRRIVRLIHSVTSITWERCESHALARVRENELLRLHRPKFNRMNVYPRAYWFMGLACANQQLRLCRTREAHRRGRLFGAFKGASVSAFGALLRLLWSAVHEPRTPFELPRQLVSTRPPMQFTLEFCSAKAECRNVAGLIERYLEGESAEIISWLSFACVYREECVAFQRAFIEVDLETLAGFFEIGPARNRRLKQEHALADRLIPQEEIDDLIALSAPRPAQQAVE